MSYACDDDIVGVCEKQILDLENENDSLREEIRQLKEELRITREGRQFFYKDAKAEHMRAERLKAEVNRLHAQRATHTNPEDTCRDDFGGGYPDESYSDEDAFRSWDPDYGKPGHRVYDCQGNPIG